MSLHIINSEDDEGYMVVSVEERRYLEKAGVIRFCYHCETLHPVPGWDDVEKALAAMPVKLSENEKDLYLEKLKSHFGTLTNGDILKWSTDFLSSLDAIQSESPRQFYHRLEARPDPPEEE